MICGAQSSAPGSELGRVGVVRGGLLAAVTATAAATGRWVVVVVRAT